MKLYKITLSVLLVATLASCRKEDKLVVGDIPGLGGDSWVQGPFDTWIKDNYTTPYNIAVKYKWDQFELELNKTLVPPREDKALAVMSAIKSVWIDTYKEEAGDLFVKKYSPKFFVLVGSVSYDVNAGTETLGTAEGGRKVVLYKINEFRTKQMPGFVPSDSNNIKQMFHTIQHEFGHILHQNVMYPTEFKNISAGLYTANWYNTSVFNARQDGFITDYALSKPDEDFVEMISMMLVEGKPGFDAIVNGITGTSPNGTTAAEAKAAIKAKEAAVVAYFKDVWNINFYSLQAKSRAAIEALIK
jgi:substrate import-associated zinc metallohydrolase lipoprotein